MRTFVEITGGKLKRVSNRRDGFYNSRTDDDDTDRSRADHRRERRASRQQLRLVAGQLADGDDSGLDESDLSRGGTTFINTDSGRGYASIR